MSFTRFHDDPERIKKQVDESSYAGRYMINTPGQGLELPFVEDPYIRMQKWGSNLQTNTINLESDLFGLTRPLNHDLIGHNDYVQNSVKSSTIKYKKEKPFVEESRLSHPAWMYKDLEQKRWEEPYLNPLHNIEIPFNTNVQSRILEKDYHVTKIPVIENMDHYEYYLTGNSICMGGNEEDCFGAPYN
jgi:hypothetical protein